MTRREFSTLFFPGVASRNVKPVAREKASAQPWNSKLTDIARAAGLRAPVIYGTDEKKSYIVEAVGCGAAFLDYDNDGWLDIFLLNGRRLDTDGGATNRLYRNH